MEINVCDTEKELVSKVAHFFIRQAQKYIRLQGRFNVVLAGGNSPKKVYEMLASKEFLNQVDWNSVYFFFGDERYVPMDDPQSNGLMALQALFKPLNISKDHIFRVQTSDTPAQAAASYMKTISSHFGENTPRFDLILLGLGNDAHTASLFPFSDILKEEKADVKPVFLEDKNQYRISMTAALINQAKQIAFLVYGQGKTNAVWNVVKGAYLPAEFPAQLIKPEEGNLVWFLDREAASLL